MCNGIFITTDCIFAIVDTCICICKAICGWPILGVFVFARPGQEGQGTSSGQEGKVEKASITQTGLGPRSHTMNCDDRPWNNDR